MGLVFILNVGNGKLLKLSTLKYICKNNSILVVFTPVSSNEAGILKKRLKKTNLVHKTFDTQICRLLGEIISGLLKPDIGMDLVIRELTEKQNKDYKDFEYKCYDKVYIPGTIPMRRSNEIEVNNHKIKLGDSVFKLFLRLALELKKTKEGWVHRHSLGSDSIIADVEKFQIYSNLRTALQGSLLDKDGQKFIENNGSKQYRISLHPDFIAYDKEKLLKHPDNSIKNIAKKLSNK
ncbi:MAG: hypothetical protein WC433_06465 [Candidatus Omnitrophota bacterium]